MPRNRRRRPGGPREALARLDAAREFLAAAEHAVTHQWWRAAVGSAAEAGIAAGDVIGYVGIGARSASADHHAALEVLREAGADASVLDALRWLLAEKNPAQYIESWAGDQGLAEDAARRARHLLAAAETAHARAQRSGWPRPELPDNPIVTEIGRDDPA